MRNYRDEIRQRLDLSLDDYVAIATFDMGNAIAVSVKLADRPPHVVKVAFFPDWLERCVDQLRGWRAAL